MAAAGALKAMRLAPSIIGTAFEERGLDLLRNRMSMTLTRIGGRGDGGVDLQGWWWIPSTTGGERRRVRVLAQCKAHDMRLGPNHVRELEGAASLHHYTGSAQLPSSTDATPAGAPESPPSSELVAVLVSLSGFTPGGIRRAMASPIPFLLLHLPPLPEPQPDEDAESEPTAFGSIIWNSKLGATNGVLGGNMEVRWDRGQKGRPVLYWCGEKLEHWIPDLEPPILNPRFDHPASGALPPLN
ncbi:hypothetical protein BDV93DRAFT_524747 [Ceratobasidium sp. AG-I]|nr:hypothetical protein BDV93DRAFT_524747 [Ceratobasidium sp. AG-I]